MLPTVHYFNSNYYKLIILFINIFLYVEVSIVVGLEAPPIHIPNQGVIIGTYLKMFRTQNIKAYLGIQYAKASRFSPPDVVGIQWSGIWNASKIPSDCWQKPFEARNDQTKMVFQLLLGNKNKDDIPKKEFDEECLNLNIFIPDGNPGVDGYAVLVWIHAGDFSHGSSTDIDPFQLVFKQKIIVVTVSYRLNIFGFLSTGDGEAQGNYGLMDQSAALFWIRKNINHFGGDATRITLMGHSAGAVSVGLHLISGEWSKNVFTKAIIMSGNPVMENAVRTPKEYEQVLDSLANTFGCIRRPTSMFIQCLKRVDAKIISDNIPYIEWGPVIDYGLSNTSFPFIEDFPLILFKKGYFLNVPILIGVTDMEDVLNFFGGDLDTKISNEDFDNFINNIALDDLKKNGNNDISCSNNQIVLDAFNYVYFNQSDTINDNMFNNLINLHTDRMYIAPLSLLADFLSKKNEVYVYFFSVRPKTKFYTLPDWIRVPKYFDQIFIWGVPYMSQNKLIHEWNSTDKKISDIVMTLWANFVKKSNPTITNVYVKWNTYNTQNQTILIINEHFKLKILGNNHIISFWNNYYPKVLRFAVECCNLTSNVKSSYYFVNNFQKMLSLSFITIVIIIITYLF